MVFSRDFFDYSILDALDKVVTLGTFESAAKALHISQPAVSQRISKLEERFSQRLLVRRSPPELTEFGEHLLSHFRRVRQMEEKWAHDHIGASRSHQTCRIAINRDSLASWFTEAAASLANNGVVIEVFPADEGRTLQLLFDGKVDVCVSSQLSDRSGYRRYDLGAMRYHCVVAQHAASPEPTPKQLEKLRKELPYIVYDHQDVHHLQFFAPTERPEKFHTVPNSTAFNAFVDKGYGYTLLPILHRKMLHSRFTDLTPGRFVDVPLYFYEWEFTSDGLRKLYQRLIKVAQNLLLPDFESR